MLFDGDKVPHGRPCESVALADAGLASSKVMFVQGSRWGS
jgi:hypothetical protein